MARFAAVYDHARAGRSVWTDSELIDRWVANISRSGSIETRTTYRQRIRCFRRYMRQWHGRHPDLEVVDEQLLAPGDPEAVEAYASALRAQVERGEMAVNTSIGRMNAVRSMFRWASEPTRRVSSGVPCTPVARGLTLPKPQRTPKALTVREVERLVAAAAQSRRAVAPGRDAALIELLYQLGARASELCSLRWADVTLSDEHRAGGGSVRIARGKGGKARTIAVGPDVLETLDRLRRWQATAPSQWVCASITDASRPLTRQGLEKLVKRAGRDAGLDVHPHMLRHSHATVSYQLDQDLVLLQRTLGHSSSATTADLYVDPAKGDSTACRLPKLNRPGADLRV